MLTAQCKPVVASTQGPDQVLCLLVQGIQVAAHGMQAQAQFIAVFVCGGATELNVMQHPAGTVQQETGIAHVFGNDFKVADETVIDDVRQAWIAVLKGAAVKPWGHGAHLEDACGLPVIVYPKGLLHKGTTVSETAVHAAQQGRGP